MYTEEVVKKIESPLWKVLMRRGILLSGAAAAGTRKQQQQNESSSHNMARAVQASNRRVLGGVGNVVVGALSVRCNVNKESVQERVRILRSFGYRNHKCLGQLHFHS